jgi:hypothetical protein
MKSFGVIVQFFMLAACLVPFTSVRQAGALLALAPTVPLQSAPTPQEDDSERVEPAGRDKERVSRLDTRAASARSQRTIAPTVRPNPALTSLAARVSVDHFRNGLGSPYLC